MGALRTGHEIEHLVGVIEVADLSVIGGGKAPHDGCDRGRTPMPLSLRQCAESRSWRAERFG